MNYVIGLLSGRALAWAQAMNACSQLTGVFDLPTYASDATDHLLNIQQGACSVADYSVEFWTLEVEARWNEPPLFRRGLNRWLQDALALQERPKDLDSLISLATALDNYRKEQRREPAVPAASAFPPTPPLFLLVPPALTQPNASGVSASSSHRNKPMQVG